VVVARPVLFTLPLALHCSLMGESRVREWAAIWGAEMEKRQAAKKARKTKNAKCLARPSEEAKLLAIIQPTKR
jgi:hypothetical protein